MVIFIFCFLYKITFHCLLHHFQTVMVGLIVNCWLTSPQSGSVKIFSFLSRFYFRIPNNNSSCTLIIVALIYGLLILLMSRLICWVYISMVRSFRCSYFFVIIRRKLFYHFVYRSVSLLCDIDCTYFIFLINYFFSTNDFACNISYNIKN